MNKVTITKLQNMSEAGVNPLWLLREVVSRGYYFYLEWPPKDYWKVLLRFRDWVVAYTV